MTNLQTRKQRAAAYEKIWRANEEHSYQVRHDQNYRDEAFEQANEELRGYLQCMETRSLLTLARQSGQLGSMAARELDNRYLDMNGRETCGKNKKHEQGWSDKQTWSETLNSFTAK